MICRALIPNPSGWISTLAALLSMLLALLGGPAECRAQMEPGGPAPGLGGPAQAIKLFDAVSRSRTSNFAGSPAGDLHMHTTTWNRTPYHMAPVFRGEVVRPIGVKAFLAGDPHGKLPWKVDNFLLLAFGNGPNAVRVVVGKCEPVSYEGVRLTMLNPQRHEFQAGQIDLTRFLPAGRKVNLTAAALDYAGSGNLSRVYLVFGKTQSGPNAKPPATKAPSGGQAGRSRPLLVLEDWERGREGWTMLGNPTRSPQAQMERLKPAARDQGRTMVFSARGDGRNGCSAKAWRKTFKVPRANSAQAYLESFWQFEAQGGRVNFPHILVELLDSGGKILGFQRYYAPDAASPASLAGARERNYASLPAKQGLMRLGLRLAGADISFSNIAISIENYVCIGSNRITANRIAFCPDGGCPPLKPQAE